LRGFKVSAEELGLTEEDLQQVKRRSRIEVGGDGKSDAATDRP
jgi:hypothetical protein